MSFEGQSHCATNCLFCVSERVLASIFHCKNCCCVKFLLWVCFTALDAGWSINGRTNEFVVLQASGKIIFIQTSFTANWKDWVIRKQKADSPCKIDPHADGGAWWDRWLQSGKRCWRLHKQLSVFPCFITLAAEDWELTREDGFTCWFHSSIVTLP